jgi:hypothetical protein
MSVLNPTPIFFLLITFVCSQKVNLEGVLCNARLPSQREDVSVLYDGDDSIYVIGGYSFPNSYKDVLKYSIPTDTIETIGNLPSPSSGGASILDGKGNIIHFGGRGGSYVYQISLQSEGIDIVASLPDTNYGFSAIKTVDQTVLIVGGIYNPFGIWSYSLNSTETIQLSQDLPAYRPLTSGVWDEARNSAYFFGGNDEHNLYNNRVILLTPPEPGSNAGHWNITELSDEFPPLESGSSVALLVGDYVYLVAGYDKSAILKFDPATRKTELLPVKNNPPNQGTNFRYFCCTGAAYVEKLQRIYMFGGSRDDIGNDPSTADIWYIDLDPPVTTSPPSTTTTEFVTNATTTTPSTTVSPTTSTTVSPTTSTTVSPTTSTTVNPTTDVTAVPTLNPGIFDCSGKPDGLYPHPQSCAKFVTCSSGNGYEFTCPDGLLFDPEELYCNFPELVDCL